MKARAILQKKIKNSAGDRVFYAICFMVVLLLTLLVLYPLIYILSASFSSGSAVTSGKVWLFPVDVSLYAYKIVFQYQPVWIGYRNTLFYTFAGTLINITLTMMCAYALSRKGLRGRRIFTFLFTFTMIFSGGMIPSYILMKNLNILNTVWVMLLPGAMSVYNMIVTRSFLQSNIPEEMLDAAHIDGCSDTRIFFAIVLPLSKTILAVNAILYASSHWNSYFNAFLYLTDKNLYPLQIILRQILVNASFSAEMLDPETVQMLASIQQILQYALIVIATAPMLCLYPFFQKYFMKGIMIGSLKE